MKFIILLLEMKMKFEIKIENGIQNWNSKLGIIIQFCPNEIYEIFLSKLFIKFHTFH